MLFRSRSIKYKCGSGALCLGDSRFVAPAARRGRRHPAVAHAVAVGAARRLHCGPGACRRQGVRQAQNSPQGLFCVRGALHRPGVASQNSLRSLRSLRSDSCDESVFDARCARRPQACASRRHRNRRRRVPPAARQQGGRWRRKPQPYPQRRARAGRSAPLRRQEAQGSRRGSADRLSEALRPARARLCRADWCASSGCRTSAICRKPSADLLSTDRKSA